MRFFLIYVKHTELIAEMRFADDSIPGIRFQVDYDLIIRSIQELNALAGEGLGEVHKTADGARIKVTQ